MAGLPKSEVQRRTPEEILPEYKKAFSIYFNHAGIQVTPFSWVLVPENKFMKLAELICISALSYRPA